MPVNGIGQKTWPNPIKKAGQLVLEYEDHYLFYLCNETFHTAGYPDRDKPEESYTDWEREVVNNSASSEGISLNTKLYKVACQSRHPEKKDLIVYDKSEDLFYVLDDHDLMLEWVYQTSRKGKTLMVTPLDAYREVKQLDRVDSKVRSLDPDRF